MRRNRHMLWEVFDTCDDYETAFWWGCGWGWVRREGTDAPVLQSCSMHDTRRAAEKSGMRLRAKGGKPVLVQTCSRVSRKHPKGWSREWGMR